MRLALGLALALVLAGPCLAEIELVLPPPAEVAPLDPGAKIAPVSFARMAADIPAGKPWAHMQYHEITGCHGDQVLTWDAKLNRFNDPDFHRIFQRELSSVGFKVAGDRDDLFAQDAAGADLEVGALITNIQASTCSATPRHPGRQKGSAVMDVVWQVYSASEAKTVARIRTTGGSRVDFVDGAASQLLQGAFAENVRQLAANPDFRRIVTSGALAEAAPPEPAAPIQVAYRTANAPVQIEDAAKGVVIVRTADGWGSGVLISADGYILTNHHVVGDTKNVRIRWPDGGETVGQVLRSDRARDVALIKAAQVKGEPLTIRRQALKLGEAVYAIGTPLDRQYQNTVTRGVVSGVRTISGHSFIQSDTPVTHGNSGGPLLDDKGAVVGLTDRGLDPAEGSVLNFFIPIDDALKTLGVTPAA